MNQVTLATQSERVALSRLSPEEIMKLGRSYHARREFKRLNLSELPDCLHIDELETLARIEFASSSNVPANQGICASNYREAPWVSDASVTNSWVMDPQYLTFGTGLGVSSVAPQKGNVPLIRSGGTSSEPQQSSRFGKSILSCLSFDGVAQCLTGDACAPPIAGANHPFSIIISGEQAALSAGGVQNLFSFAASSDSSNFSFLRQTQVAGNEVYRMFRNGSIVTSSFPFPTTAAQASNGYWRHVFALIYNGTTAAFYVDDILTSINSALSSTSISFTKFTLMAFRGATTSSFMGGKIRSVLFGTTAFSSATRSNASAFMRQEAQMAASPKKGIVLESITAYGFPTSPNPAFGSFQNLNVNWYSNYTVSPWGTPDSTILDPITSYGSLLDPGIEFVPMIAGPNVADSAQNCAWAQASGTELLTYNEPDGAFAHVPVSAAISRWPALVALGLRIGAPAVAAGANLTIGWLHDFMTDPSNPHVDFIPVHYYIPASSFSNATAAVSGLLSYINGTFALYGKPVWLHEWNALGFNGSNAWSAPTTAQNITLLQRTVPWLEATGACEKYSLYAMHCPLVQLPGVYSFPSMGCVKDDASMPTIGPTYADLGRR